MDESASQLTRVLRGHLRSRRLRGWLAVLTASTLGLAFVPLFNTLGFEFALVMALLGSIASADLGCALVRQARALLGETAPGRPGALLWALLWQGAALHTGLLTVPLLLIALNGLRVSTCDWTFGLLCYLLMTVLSAVIATATGLTAALLWGHRTRLAAVTAQLAIVLSVLLSLAAFYGAPPVFSYNPFVGYFPGNLYDEAISLGPPLYWSRAAQLATIGLVLALCAAALDLPGLRLRLRGRRPAGRRLEAGLVALISAAAALPLWLSSGQLGFAITGPDIQEALGGRHDTEHFTIFYPPVSEIARDIERIAEDHEFRYAQAVRTLGAAPAGRITSYYFERPEDKYRWMGARQVYMAKPWRSEIYLHHQGFPHQILRHEIAHVVAGSFGDPLFHVSIRRRFGLPLFFNVGLIEGIAVATDWPDHFTRHLTPHQSVRAMQELDLLPPLSRVLSTGFFAFSSARSYTLAGSFVRFLLEHHGAAALRVLYRTGGEFERAYGRPLAALEGEWRRTIAAITLPPGTAEMVRERFRRGGIFQRDCPHAIARKRSRAAELGRKGRWDDAVDLLRSACRDAPEEPEYRLELAAALTRAGAATEARDLVEKLLAAGRPTAAAAGGAPPLSSTLHAEARLLLARLDVHRNDLAAARQQLEAAAGLPIDDDLRRNIIAQRLTLQHGGPAGPALRAFFWSADPRHDADPVVLAAQAAAACAAEPGHPLGYYLLARSLRGHGGAQLEVAALRTALELTLPHPLLVREAARHLAEAAYRADDLAAVERAAAILTAPDQPEVDRLYGQDWLERLYWKRHGRLPGPAAPARSH
jgi:hypothetical protein